ncbi:MAG TPA: biopolymer transporter ExbD [Thermoanaerobaculia bacterium]|nr:biopolymer transporter ExbD [Thermoanaerobaculia bacterium]
MRLSRSKLNDEIPTSSMADIAFLLIIYFMVTTTFTATRGLDFAPPKDDDNPPIIEKEDSVLVEIRSDGSLVVDQRPLPLDELIEYLKPKLDANPEKPVIIRPDPASPYGSMVDVMDELRQGKEKGLKEEVRISLPTQREIDALWF